MSDALAQWYAALDAHGFGVYKLIWDDAYAVPACLHATFKGRLWLFVGVVSEIGWRRAAKLCTAVPVLPTASPPMVLVMSACNPHSAVTILREEIDGYLCAERKWVSRAIRRYLSPARRARLRQRQRLPRRAKSR